MDAFVEAVEAATGRPVVYYLLDGWADRYPTTTERPHWVRSMPWRPAGDWVWWQVNSRARVEGIGGPVDSLCDARGRPRSRLADDVLWAARAISREFGHGRS